METKEMKSIMFEALMHYRQHLTNKLEKTKDEKHKKWYREELDRCGELHKEILDW